MEINENTIVGQLVAADYRTADVFRQHGIDFCCKGNKPISDVCREKKLEIAPILHALEKISAVPACTLQDFNTMPLDQLADHIVRKHHAYVREKIPVLQQYLRKVCQVHGEPHQELWQIAALFTATSAELSNHLNKEELILFPRIREIARKKAAGEYLEDHSISAVEKPISAMMDEHDHEGDRFRRIADLSNNFTPPEDACNTYRVTYALLKEFQDDLHQHIHLENNILFPRTISTEKTLTGSSCRL
ncbi:iron-sulfur cluster repair di-iron protein [Chitinophaga varians]|uniref:iron-sulfur cluster repair di-iron protein n=1 Tax=Chitinophaga varians TaxID=2202339 RepID=UPI00165EC69C|nr:iron-sulfur cluster repair di-iron protein [Chitinophaga varians]MBC9914380.1 iron-sulfur cluster repair di-iron protein [Chitinophaga varians]